MIRRGQICQTRSNISLIYYQYHDIASANTSSQKVKSGIKYILERGSRGEPGPAYPEYSESYIYPTGDLPCAGTDIRGQGIRGLLCYWIMSFENLRIPIEGIIRNTGSEISL